ncbi:retinoblastoma-associated protein rb -related [Holotrichia oblita]|uniref:Retinoblastoma-associated protein rb -related n=1 Tax=Holotrichia oblita TaxID=644536 RepID=A0ACB9TP79_HOLOL|nr:retinoblastoma-associated protein rb -related [Holotrichia oblita]
MVSTEDTEDITLINFRQLADKLNLEQNVCTQAWNSYQQIRPKFDLEGDELHWLGCAIFVACRNTITPTIGQSVLEGNCISLTSLLRHSNLSLMQFFNKIKRWAEMTKMNEEFHRKIETLQSKVAVAFNIFQKYCPVFKEIFNALMDTDSKQHRNRRQRPPPCTTMQLFDFCWLLFITVKTEDDSYSKDLVMSHHLLHACCDLVFQNAFFDERKDLLNPNFECLPREWSNPDYIVPEEAPCIISSFYKEDVKDAIYVKKYKFRDIIRGFFEKRILQGNNVDFTGLLNPTVFDINYNALKKIYETHLLNKGDFDERILLAEYRRQRKLKEQASLGNSCIITPYSKFIKMPSIVAENPDSAHSLEGSRQAPITPLTGRRFLGPKRISDTHSSIAHNIMSLQNLVANRAPNPSEELCTIFKFCKVDPTESIRNIFSQLQTRYCEKCSQLSDINATEVNHRALLTLKLVYKFLEHILKSERKRNPDISFLMQKDSFFHSLYACSLEIVEYSHNTHNSPREFPWVLSALELTVYDFVKVIEITIRSDDQLPRYIIKHLSWVCFLSVYHFGYLNASNRRSWYVLGITLQTSAMKIDQALDAKEHILETLMWVENSALWRAITQSGEDIPKFEDIALPGYMKYGSTQNDVKPATNNTNTDSPGPSATETFQSPNVNSNSANVVSSQVKKNLFPTIKPGQSVLQNSKPTHLMVTDEDGNRKFVKIVDSPNSEQIVAIPSPVPDAKPKKGGSLCIIFRKFYNLAGVRMDHLCSKLGITAMDLQCKIWTVFEYSVRYTDLMRNRHLDQLLMCAVYVICKVTGKTYQFTDIMKQYREQPQANSDIYRSVLIKEDATPNRSDLIQFYNKVYVTKIQEFALKFSNQTTNLPLSPLPVVKPLIASPKTEIQKNIFIKPYDSPTKAFNTGRVMHYCFNRSTSEVGFTISHSQYTYYKL